VQLAMLTIRCFSGSNVSRLMPGNNTASQSQIHPERLPVR
jgi:hypothetical protein